MQNTPVNNGMEVGVDALVTNSSLQVSRDATRFLVPEMGHPLCTDVTQLLTAWENKCKTHDQQNGDKISDAIKLGVVLHHLPDVLLRHTYS